MGMLIQNAGNKIMNRVNAHLLNIVSHSLVST